ncbi:DUF4961 domain-containing protein [bacterium]|nr:DUF4961 domain-containing protein [bacterium]
MKHFIVLLLSLLSFQLSAQIVSLNPATAGPDDAVTLVFDAAAGNAELQGAEKVYVHHGVVTDKADGTSWQYVKGNWGKDDGVGQMTKVAGEDNKWQISFTPSIREYFGVPAGTNIFRISCVFRSADGSAKATISQGTYGWGSVSANGDIFINLNVGNFISFSSPTTSMAYFNANDKASLSAVASAEVSDMKLWLDDGSGKKMLTSVSSGKTISYDYTVTKTALLAISVTATINGESLSIAKDYNVVVKTPGKKADLPAGVRAGINYDKTDETKATLVLQAPEKSFAYVVGDFTNWQVLDAYQMNQTTDGEYFWLEIRDLSPGKPYVFQYWVDEDVKIGDPYCELVVDPWNDSSIPAEVFPNIPEYNKTEYETASALQTAQAEYQWAASEQSWQRPSGKQMVIYELLVRDFLKSHSYTDLTDTLSYLKRLGVDAVEIMPFNEFEGNSSWGYNPSYYFAPDKYYGTADKLKHFIEKAHEMGIAVIMDMVLNHAYGQNPMVKLYFNKSTGKPAANNPWFNVDAVGPYSWGYDFNHTSDYTKAFVDRVNEHWLKEFHIDGYRFDFTKGFTNNGPNIDGYDADRIAILKRMSDQIWSVDPKAIVILEHWGGAQEENELGAQGMIMWRNRSYDYVPAAAGNFGNGNFSGMNDTTHVSYFDSHDEQRLAQQILASGVSNVAYSAKNPLVMLERAKLTAAFMLLYPGPKMIWQFDELAYDISIDYNGRIGEKPLPWGSGALGYYEDTLRQYVYKTYQNLLAIRKAIGAQNLQTAETNHQESGALRRLSYHTDNFDLVLVGNFGVESGSIDPAFTQLGSWYDYFTGEILNITNTNQTIQLQPGEWHVYTTKKLSNGKGKTVAVYANPVSVSPYPFTQNDEITITFDATKAWPNGTNGLVGAQKVYMHSGVVVDNPTGEILSHVVGTLSDDGLGEMTKVGNNLWQITLTPNDYYGLNDKEAFRIGMYFRDTDNKNVGYGFRNAMVFVEIDSDKPFITVSPAAFMPGDEITITFNARKGNRELVGASSVYMHSSVALTETQQPWIAGWNHAVGNWGADDGLGKMTKVPGEQDLWQITIKPKTYYNLSDGDHVFWLAMVFRNADGSAKGTGTPGPILNGWIHTNLDFFVQNLWDVAAPEVPGQKMQVYPNPAQEQLYVVAKTNAANQYVEVLDMQGQTLIRMNYRGGILPISLQQLQAGMYLLRLVDEQNVSTTTFIKQ